MKPTSALSGSVWISLGSLDTILICEGTQSFPAKSSSSTLRSSFQALKDVLTLYEEDEVLW
jgi:hypothetical protein